MTQQRWSYRIVEIKPSFLGRIPLQRIQDELDKSGAQGWELVSAPTMGYTNVPGTLRLYFKRPQ